VPSISLVVTAVIAATSAGLAFAQSGSPTLARDLAATCANCHGTNGVSVGEVPSLAGKSRDELLGKMQAFKTGALPGTIMQQLAKGYTDEQIELVAGWFATQKPAVR
jgi:cytochrome c553